MREILVATVLGLLCCPVYAESELNYAIKAGPNAATLEADYRVNRYGISGGLAAYPRWVVSERFAFAGQIDLLYTPRGAEVVRDGEYLGKTRRHYFDVGVLARSELLLDPVSIYLLLGGGLDVLVSASKEDAAGKQDITDGLRRMDVALLAGVGFSLTLPGESLGPFHLGAFFFEIRHDHGLRDTDVAVSGYKNRASSLMLGLSFVLGSAERRSMPTSPSVRGAPPSHVMATLHDR